MATVVFTYDHSRDPMSPGDLAARIVSSLGLSSMPMVDINPTQIVVTHPNVSEANRTAIQSLITAYTLDPAWQGQPADNTALLLAKARQALTTNHNYLGHAAVPSGTLSTAQLSSIVRILSDQTDALTRQMNAIIKLLSGTVTDLTDT